MPTAVRRWLLPLLAVVLPGPAVAEQDDEGGEVRAPTETVEVVGQRAPGEPDPLETAASVTVITLDERVRASADVADVVGAAAGVHLQRLGGLGDYSVVTVRGSSARQVEVYVDGVPLNPYGGTAVDLSELPLDAFERVEVYRSGAPAHLGTSAMGGVVNLVTAPGEVAPPRLEMSGGSYWTRRLSASAGVAGRAGAADTPVDLLLGADTFGTTGDFEFFDDAGTPYNLLDDRTLSRINNDKADFDARARLRVGDRRLRLVLSETFHVRDQGLPGIGHDQAEEARLGTLDNAVVTSLDGRPGATVRLRGRVSYRLRQERYRDPHGELGTGLQDSRDRHHAAGGQIGVRWVPAVWTALDGTVELRVDGYQPVDLLRDDSTDGVRTRVAAVFSLADELVFAGERVHLTPVLQLHLLDNRLLGTVPFADSPVAPDGRQHHAAFTPRLGMLIRPAPLVAFKANVARSFRPPDFSELFGDRGAVIGNTELVPESGIAWDGGAHLACSRSDVLRGSASVTYFGRRTRNAIVYVQNSQRTQIPINLGSAELHGVEGSVDTHVAGLLEFRADLTWIHSTNLDEREAYLGNPLPRVPTWEVRVAAAVHWRDHVRLGYELSHTAGNYWDATSWYLAAPRTLHGLSLRVQPGPAWPFLEVDVRNLTDRTTEAVPRDPLNPDDGALVVQPLTDFVGYPLPGRTILVTLGGSFGRVPGGGGEGSDAPSP